MRVSLFPLALPAVALIAACSSSTNITPQPAPPAASSTPAPGASPTPSGTPASAALTQIGFDPYSNADAQHATAVETNIIAHGKTLVAGYHVARLTAGGVTNIGWAVSQDGGASWQHGVLSGTTTYAGGALSYVTDPVVAYDAKHATWMITYVGGTPYGAFASLSHDDGKTWSAPVTIATNGQPDKNWTTCDDTPTSPNYGTCYTEYDDNSTNAVSLTRSTDGGASWSAPAAPSGGFAGIAGAPVTLPSGRVVVPIADSGFTELSAFTSDDGGASWSAPAPISAMRAVALVSGLRSDPNPSATVDSSGRIYVTWDDCGLEPSCASNDLVMVTSTDGASWSSPVQIAGGAGVNHLYPGIGADPSSGKLGVAFYTVSSTNQIDAYYSSSSDRGATWSTPFHLGGPMDLSWISTTSRGTMIGDYTGVAFANGTAFPVFSLALQPTTQQYDQGVYVWPQP